jgi:predicted RNase H-like nuclease (RuvC/YqgF family)
MPDELDGLQPAANGDGKCTGRGRFQRKQRTKDHDKRGKAAEAAAREPAEQDYAPASTNNQRPAAEVRTLRTEVGCLEKDIVKLKNQAESLEYQLESERERSRTKEVCAKELRAAVVESDIAHAARLAKVCNQRDSLGRIVRKLKAQHSSGSLSAARCRAKAMAAKARMAPCLRRPSSAGEAH